MSKERIANFFKKCTDGLKRHSPEILTGLGISGMIFSTIYAVKSTPKALMLIDKEKKEKKKDKLTTKEIVKITWKCYIPSVISTVASSACIIGASAINLKRNTALATAYSLSESALKLYQEKVIETIGEKKEQEIRDNLAEERLKQHPIAASEVIITDKGNTLCFDSVSGRYFKSDIETLRRAVNELNRRMTINMSMSLNDYYYEIGLDGIKVGDSLGWNVNKALIELIFSSKIAEDGTPCLVVDFRSMPEYDYD